MKDKIKTLWQQCFDDSPEFVELYFRLRYTDENNLVLCQDDGTPIAAMQLLPYPMTFCGTEIPTVYLYGVCTHPDHRGKGIMTRLLGQALERMYQDDILLSTLIPAEPWLFDYYAKNGYVPAFNDYTRLLSTPETLNCLQGKHISIFHEDTSAPDLYAYLNTHLHRRSCCIQHTEADFQMVIADLRISGGFIYTRRDDNGYITALAILYPGSEGYILAEYLSDEIDTDNRQLVNPLFVSESSLPLGMGRIIRADKFLSLYASTHPEICINYALTDLQLPVNNGYYHLHGGGCTKHPVPQAGTQYLPITIHNLTDEILRPLHPRMSLMLNL